MGAKEAILKRLKNHKEQMGHAVLISVMLSGEDLDELIQALEKQMPNRPIQNNMDGTWHCSCGYEVANDRYCDNCGQRLEVSEC